MFVIMQREEPVAIRVTMEETVDYCRKLAEDIRDNVKATIEPLENGCMVHSREVIFTFLEVADAPAMAVLQPVPKRA